MVEPGPFGTGLLASGQATAYIDILETYVIWLVFRQQWVKVLHKCCLAKVRQTHNGL
jgi:hypothetical protein